MWKRILISVYNIKGLKASSDTFGHIKTGTWASLVSEDTDTRKIREVVEEGMKLVVGDGKSIRFWHDKWATIGVLKNHFNRLFLISTQGDAMICDMGVWVENEWLWQLRWRRSLFEWEKEDLERLNLLLEDIRPNNNTADGVNWNGVDYQRFPVKAITEKVYEAIDPVLPSSITSFIWSIKVPPRVLLTIWLANLEKLKTGDFLVNKGLIDHAQALCPFCEEALESNSHLLFTCHFSWGIWMRVLQWCGITGVLPNRCIQFVEAWRRLNSFKRKAKLWNLILGCVIWSLWYERNKIKFNNGEPNGDLLFYTLRIRISIWAKELLGVDLASGVGYTN